MGRSLGRAACCSGGWIDSIDTMDSEGEADRCFMEGAAACSPFSLIFEADRSFICAVFGGKLQLLNWGPQSALVDGIGVVEWLRPFVQGLSWREKKHFDGG